jgi:hypothetical protein
MGVRKNGLLVKKDQTKEELYGELNYKVNGVFSRRENGAFFSLGGSYIFHFFS